MAMVVEALVTVAAAAEVMTEAAVDLLAAAYGLC